MRFGTVLYIAICGLALLTFFQFPGHTWLQQDTQIYTPILEHLRDPSVLDRDLMVQYPVLINRPIVVTPLGVKLCRPSEAVLDILPNPEIGTFTKEDGEVVVGTPRSSKG